MIGLLFTLILFGAVLYLVEHYVPLSPPVLVVIRVVVVLILVWYVLRFFGVPLGPPFQP